MWSWAELNQKSNANAWQNLLNQILHLVPQNQKALALNVELQEKKDANI